MPWLLSVLILFVCALPAHAQEVTVPVTKDLPFAVPYSFQGTPNTQYSLKMRFSDDPAKCVPACTGQTWHDGTWLKQSDAWSSYPTVQTNDAGLAMGVLAGRSTEQTVPDLLQIAYLEQGKSSSNARVLAYSTVVQEAKGGIILRVLKESGEAYQSGYFAIDDGVHLQLVPLTEDAVAEAQVAGATITVRFYPALDASAPVVTESFSVQGTGPQSITLNARFMKQYHPRLVTDSGLHPNVPATFWLETSPSYEGAVSWLVNDEKQSETTDALEWTPPKSGSFTVKATVMDTGETALQQFAVNSYGNIILTRLLPNPVGSDTNAETITLENRNAFAVVLKNWTLQSRTSSTAIGITTSIPAQSAVTLTVSNKLVNSGGVYDLINESGQVVDSVTYTAVDEGGVVTRTASGWVMPQPTTSSTVSSEEESQGPESALEGDGQKVTLEGIVTAPSGRTLDMLVGNQSVHVVVHESYTAPRPRLKKGVRLRVSGLWREGTHGAYVSVRAGDTFELVLAPTAAGAATESRTDAPDDRSPPEEEPTLLEALGDVVPEFVSEAEGEHAGGLFGAEPAHAADGSEHVSGEGVGRGKSSVLPFLLAALVAGGVFMRISEQKEKTV